MGIFNAVIETDKSDSISKVKFNVDLSGYATKKQFKAIKREMEEYLHRNKELDNKMTRPLDMGGNEIINLGNPEKPNDATPRRYIFRKLQSLVKDYDLEDIKNIKETLQSSSTNINQLIKDLKQNEKTIVELQGKIEKEMETLSNTIKLLEEKSDTTDDAIKEVFKKNIIIIHDQIKELKGSMIKHQELKNKIDEAEKKLQNMYQLEIKTEISKLNEDTRKRDQDLLNKFSSDFAKYKATLEKSSSQRGDELELVVESYNTQLTKFRTSFQTSITAVNGRYTELSNVLTALKEIEIAQLDLKVTSLDNKLGFAVEDMISNKDAIKGVKDEIKSSIEDVKGEIEDVKGELKKIETGIGVDKIIQSKQISDLGQSILDLVKEDRKLKRKLSKLNDAMYETILFEFYNNRPQEVGITSLIWGIPVKYESTDSFREIETPDFFIFFGLSSSPVVNYSDYIQLNQNFDIVNIASVQGFMVKKPGKYIIAVKLIIKIIFGDVKKFVFKWYESEVNRDNGNIECRKLKGTEIIEREVKEDKYIFEKDLEVGRLDLNDTFIFYPELTSASTQTTTQSLLLKKALELDLLILGMHLLKYFQR